jgi:hypothetical protein
MSTYAELGHNRTGIGTARQLTERMLEASAGSSAAEAGDGREMILRLRADYSRDAEPLGSVPPPTSAGAAIQSATRGLRALRPAQYIDKLGERLAFERVGVRLCEGLIAKLEASGGFEGGPSRAELEQMIHIKYEHFRLLREAIENAGCDPTVLTPSADLYLTMLRGIVDVVFDPRTTFAQCLEALLVVELVESDAWEALGDLAQQSAELELARLFEAASLVEGDHLDAVRAWLAAAQHRPL